MNCGEVNEHGEASSTRSEKVVHRYIKVRSYGESKGAKEVDDKGGDGGGERNGLGGIMDNRIAETEMPKDDGSHGGVNSRVKWE